MLSSLPKAAEFKQAGLPYPLAALAGQERMKLALLLLAVDPGLGGVLLVGQKGTAKSTSVRAVAELLPPLTAVPGCPYNCHPDRPEDLCLSCRKKQAETGRLSGIRRAVPFLTLPLGATEDRIVGGLDLELTSHLGRPEHQPGLLGLANRGFLYVDEINLLEPYLAHLLLDAVESGRLHVEREGLSLWHPARAALIGTMNPEEGALGPQLADRFALTVPVVAESDPKTRSEIVRRRLAYESDPAGFREEWASETARLAGRLVQARRRVLRLLLTGPARKLITELAGQYGIKGHRGDLALSRGALALAAWQGDQAATEEHVRQVAELALKSRRIKKRKRTAVVQVLERQESEPARHYDKPYLTPAQLPPSPAVHGAGGDGLPLAERLFAANESFEVVTPVDRRERGPRERSGRRTARRSNAARGRYYRSSPERLGRPLALDATIRTAAVHQKSRRSGDSTALIIRCQDIMEKVYRQKTGRLVLFVVDASGSVGSLSRMSEAKAAVLSLLGEAYQKRDRVGLISFHGDQARVLLPPTNSVETASSLLKDLPTGGKTPLAAALLETHKLVRTELARDPGLTPLIVIMTDGRPNVPLDPEADPWPEALKLASLVARDRRLKFLLVDTDCGHYADYKLTRDLAERLGGPRLTLEDLRQGRLANWLERLA